MSINSLRLVEQAFNLPEATMLALFSESGSYSHHHTYSASPRKIEKFRLVLKAPQKKEVANYVLSYSHDVAKSSTTALIFGEKLFSYPNQAKSQAAQILHHIKAGKAFWTHPAFLPTILLENHVARATKFVIDLDDNIVSFEGEIGLVRAGRLTNIDKNSRKTIDKDILRNLTEETYTALTQVSFLRRVVVWEEQCADFLLAQIQDLEFSLPQPHDQRTTASSAELLEMVLFLKSVAVGLQGSQASWQNRAQSQVNAISSFLGQIDNRLSAKLAKTSSRDGAAMKILAVITAVFLPGTFIASVFSMSVFDWRASLENGSTGIVSSTFWVYWVVAVPLTILLLGGWRVWWRIQDDNFERELKEAECLPGSDQNRQHKASHLEDQQAPVL